MITLKMVSDLLHNEHFIKFIVCTLAGSLVGVILAKIKFFIDKIFFKLAIMEQALNYIKSNHAELVVGKFNTDYKLDELQQNIKEIEGHLWGIKQ